MNFLISFAFVEMFLRDGINYLKLSVLIFLLRNFIWRFFYSLKINGIISLYFIDFIERLLISILFHFEFETTKR